MLKAPGVLETLSPPRSATTHRDEPFKSTAAIPVVSTGSVDFAPNLLTAMIPPPPFCRRRVTNRKSCFKDLVMEVVATCKNPSEPDVSPRRNCPEFTLTLASRVCLYRLTIRCSREPRGFNLPLFPSSTRLTANRYRRVLLYHSRCRFAQAQECCFLVQAEAFANRYATLEQETIRV